MKTNRERSVNPTKQVRRALRKQIKNNAPRNFRTVRPSGNKE